MAVATAPPPGSSETTPAPALPAGAQPVQPASGRGLSVLGVALVIAADAMVVGALIAAYLGMRSAAAFWPPKGASVDRYIGNVTLITIVMSAFSAQWARHAARRDDRRNLVIGLGLTAVLALAVANAEWFAISRQSFGVGRHAFGTMHAVLIGYHLANVVAAVVLLVVTGFRAASGQFDAEHHDAVAATTAFWQFVVVAWIAVFACLFVLK